MNWKKIKHLQQIWFLKPDHKLKQREKTTRGDRARLFSFFFFNIQCYTTFTVQLELWLLEIETIFRLATMFLFTFVAFCVCIFPHWRSARLQPPRWCLTATHVTLRLPAAPPVCQLMLVMVSSVASDIFEWNNNHTRIRTVLSFTC